MATLQAVKDWHLTTAVMVISAVIFLMSFLSAAVTPLRPDLRLRPDVERPSGVTVCELHACSAEGSPIAASRRKRFLHSVPKMS